MRAEIYASNYRAPKYYSKRFKFYIYVTNQIRCSLSLSEMGFTQRHCFLFLFLQLALLLLSSHVHSSDEEENLLKSLNSYRASLNLTSLTENDNAECFADELADQFKGQPCSNTTGAASVPGTEPQLSTYPNLLAKCHLNFTNTKDGQIMPVCVPNLVPNLVLTNYTQSQYTRYLNDSAFTGVGIGSEGDWIVVVLSTNTGGGSYAPAHNENGASLVYGTNLVLTMLTFMLGFVFLQLS